MLGGEDAVPSSPDPEDQLTGIAAQKGAESLHPPSHKTKGSLQYTISPTHPSDKEG